ncbi:hypothetical protein C8R44DRAFT_747849 [Mycena epipterygia]|nr:hypothetical protein C8R44DRAFT_747849 [Mycena epipterygia]
MTSIDLLATAAPTPAQELEALVALVAQLPAASLEATRLSVEVQAKLPTIAAKLAASDAQLAAAQLAATSDASAAADTTPLFVRHTPKTPSELQAEFPPGSSEVWYVVIIGREPGLYRTATEANDQCNGVPNQFKEKRKSRCEALAWYAECYFKPSGDGVQKWVEV